MKLNNNLGQLIDFERVANNEILIPKSYGKGVFFLNLLFEDGRVASKRIIVQ